MNTPTKPPETHEPRDPGQAEEALADIQSLLRQTRPAEDEEGAHHAPSITQAALASRVVDLHPADLAFVLEALPPDDRRVVWEAFKAMERDDADELAGEVLLEVSDAVRETLVESMDRDELVAAAETLDVDELADIAEDLPQEVVEEVRQGLSVEEREQLRAAMSYADDTVGALMDFDMVTVRDDVTCEVVLRYLRQFNELPSQTDRIFVVERNETLKGALAFDKLLINDPEVMVADLVESDIVAFSPNDAAREAAVAFERYGLVSAPVVDVDNKLIGRLTVDEVLDFNRESQEETALSRAGLRDEEDIFAPVRKSVWNRAPWLMLNLVTAGIASYVASRFEGTVSQIVMLAFLMSIVAGIAGNSGNQTMTLIVRALALGQIGGDNVKHLVIKEFAVTLAIGLGGGLFAGLFAYLISGKLGLGAVMMAAILLNLMVGAGIGIFVPLMRARMGRDPAVGSSVLLTFATDTMGFLIFLGLATLFLL
jgi:magnesium transporter